MSPNTNINYQPLPSSTIPISTVSNSTYINPSASIPEPIKTFDGLDHNYTPKEHIEARATYSLGLQPSTDHEYELWHGRRMAFIQCSLTGTTPGW